MDSRLSDLHCALCTDIPGPVVYVVSLRRWRWTSKDLQGEILAEMTGKKNMYLVISESATLHAALHLLITVFLLYIGTHHEGF